MICRLITPSILAEVLAGAVSKFKTEVAFLLLLSQQGM